MITLFNQLLRQLGSPKDQKSETIALIVVYCMSLSFTLVMVVVMLMVIRPFQIEAPRPAHGTSSLGQSFESVGR